MLVCWYVGMLVCWYVGMLVTPSGSYGQLCKHAVSYCERLFSTVVFPIILELQTCLGLSCS